MNLPSIFCFLLIYLATSALAHTTLTGTVRDGTAKPFPFVSIALLSTRDSSLVKGTISKESGVYEFDNIRPGQYKLMASAVGNQTKARSLVSANFMGRSPAPTDSANIDKTLKDWEANYKTQLNRKITFVTQTFRVLSGNLKGNWVSMCGDYTFTDAQSSKTVRFPFQYTASVADGKITGDRVYYD